MATIIKRGPRWRAQGRRQGHPFLSRSFATRANAGLLGPGYGAQDRQGTEDRSWPEGHPHRLAWGNHMTAMFAPGQIRLTRDGMFDGEIADVHDHYGRYSAPREP
jgi:hypothetical protein